ncbi:MAG: BTAD domain-containing putative transcriptional regulator [Gemmatimonadales bacterium]
MTILRRPTRSGGGPLQLLTLGPVRLEGGPAQALARVLEQPKRAALLAYLAARRAGEMVRRDQVLALFWPEHSTTRAQGNLRNALYFLRRALGSDTVVARGDLLGVAPERLECDAAVLLAPTGADPSSALSLYRGEFLEGLHLSDAPDFERWVDRTSASLRGRATELAWVLAARAEALGQWITAAGYARRAALLAVDVEGATQRLIRLLDRAGDRAAAIDAHAQLARRLEEDYGVAPSPETVALIDSVRGRVAAPRPPARSEEPVERPFGSLAVLPFEDLSGGAARALADGICEELLTALARIRDVRVVSRTSVRRFGQHPPSSMGAVRDALGVDLVLEGSVRLEGKRVRVAVQLIDAARDTHLWADLYDGTIAELFAFESDLAIRVTRALETRLSPREHRRIRRPPTSSLEAWQLYRRGREIWGQRSPQAATRAARLFSRALELDPRFAQAWVGLADAHLVRAVTGGTPLAEAKREARQAIDRALDCDPESGEARATLGLVLAFLEWDLVASANEHRRSVELCPGYPPARQWHGQSLAAMGRAGEGVAEVEAALDLDAFSPAINEGLGLALYHAGRIGEAVAQLRRTLELDRDFWRPRIPLALALADLGDVDAAARELVAVWQAGAYGLTAGDARRAAAALEQSGPDAVLELLGNSARARVPTVPAVRVLEIVVDCLLDRQGDALSALEAARREGTLGLVLMYAPVLDRLAGAPRFQSLVDKTELRLPRWGAGGA